MLRSIAPVTLDPPGLKLGVGGDTMGRILAILVIASVATSTSGAVLAAHPYDGRWRVHAKPETGSCKKEHLYHPVIENGAIRQGTIKLFKIASNVQPGGHVQISLERRDLRIDVTG